jgi:hypothetical protein
MLIGNKPKYVTSQPSTFMKTVEDELKEKRAKDMAHAKEKEAADNANDEEHVDKG